LVWREAKDSELRKFEQSELDKLRTRFKQDSAINLTGAGHNTLAECVVIERGAVSGAINRGAPVRRERTEAT